MADLVEGQVGLNPTIDFIAGTVSGIAGLLVGHPFDTVKVRFQNPETASKYSNTFGAVRTIVKEEKVVGLYKGVSSPLATVAIMNGMVFASYKFFMKLQLDHADQIPTLTQIALAGMGSGIACSVITTPVELIKIRQQSSLSLNRVSAPQVALQIVKASGFFGLYRGFSATVVRDIGYGAYFWAYEATLRLLSHASSPTPSPDTTSIKSESLSWPVLLFAGGVAGIVGWAATFPFDVVKTRMQGPEPRLPGLISEIESSAQRSPLLPQISGGATGSTTSGGNPYRSMYSTIVHSYRTEGLGVFFKGLAPTVIRAFPVNMVTFATFEAVVHAFS